jgi:hypothetical protein
MAAARMTPVTPNPAAMDVFEAVRVELVEALARMVNRVIQHGKAEAQAALVLRDNQNLCSATISDTSMSSIALPE